MLPGDDALPIAAYDNLDQVPAWRSPSGQRTSREIREVWRCRSAGGHSVVPADTAGERFDCGMVPDHEAPIEEELILRVAFVADGFIVA